MLGVYNCRTYTKERDLISTTQDRVHIWKLFSTCLASYGAKGDGAGGVADQGSDGLLSLANEIDRLVSTLPVFFFLVTKALELKISFRILSIKTSF